MMKSKPLFIYSVLLSGLLASCSQTSSSNSTSCAKAGLFGSQSECANSTGGVCTMSTISSGGSNTVCWKNTSQTSGTTTGGTTTGGTTTSGSGQACIPGAPPPPATPGAWSPAECAPGVTQRTRTVTCNWDCACAPLATTETCEGDLYGGQHYSSQCTQAGGTVNNAIDGNKKACVFNASACPNGWNPIVNAFNVAFTKTTATSAEEHTSCTGGRTTRTTGSHNMNSVSVETLSICTWRTCVSGCRQYTTISASVTQVACY